MFRVKLANFGKRDAIDVTIKVRVAIYELGFKKTWFWYDMETNASTVPSISRGRNRLVVLRAEETPDFSRPLFPAEIRQKYESGTLTVEDILALGTKSYLRIYVFAFDSFSGARKLFSSPRYDLRCIREGVFSKFNVVDESGSDEQDEKIDPL